MALVIWLDVDQDGVQDPSEAFANAFRVELYDATGTLVGVDLTDTNGQYLFDDSNVDVNGVNNDGSSTNGFDGLTAGAVYYIVYVGDGYNDVTNEIMFNSTTYLQTSPNSGEGNQPDLNDSDASEIGIPTVGARPAVNFTASTTNHSFDLGLRTTTPLPVELSLFTAEPKNLDAQLIWKTASESNNSHFELEVSKNGIDFELVTIINSKAPNGNSDNELSYDFLDENAAYRNTDVHYRLKQVDLDGGFEYSSVRLVRFEDADITVKLFPNPVKQEQLVTIQAKNISMVEVFDMYGRMVQSIEERGNPNSISLPTANLTPGVYIVIINNSKSKKLIVN